MYGKYRHNPMSQTPATGRCDYRSGGHGVPIADVWPNLESTGQLAQMFDRGRNGLEYHALTTAPSLGGNPNLSATRVKEVTFDGEYIVELKLAMFVRRRERPESERRPGRSNGRRYWA